MITIESEQPLAIEVVPYSKEEGVDVLVTMIGKNYIDFIIRSIVQPDREEVGPNFVFNGDSVRPFPGYKSI